MYKNKCRINGTKYVPTSRAICRVKIEHAILGRMKKAKNLSCHTDLFKLVTSSLIKGIQMGEKSRLG
jgi:hypothetical protein